MSRFEEGVIQIKKASGEGMKLRDFSFDSMPCAREYRMIAI